MYGCGSCACNSLLFFFAVVDIRSWFPWLHNDDFLIKLELETHRQQNCIRDRERHVLKWKSNLMQCHFNRSNMDHGFVDALSLLGVKCVDFVVEKI